MHACHPALAYSNSCNHVVYGVIPNDFLFGGLSRLQHCPTVMMACQFLESHCVALIVERGTSIYRVPTYEYL